MKACVICGCTEDRACVTDGIPCTWSVISTPATPICTACEPTARAIAEAVEFHDGLPF